MSQSALHVAYVIESPYPSFVVREIAALRRAGVRVTVLNSFRPFGQDGTEAEDLRRESLYFPAGVLRAVLDTLRVVARHPLRFARAAAAVAWNRAPPRLLPLAAHYALAVETRRIAHVHGMYATTPAAVALLTAGLSGVPFSFTAHAYDIYLPNRLFPWKLRRARFMTTVSRFNRELILRRWERSDPRKVHVVYLGASSEGRAPSGLAARPGPARLLCVAQLLPCKGHAVLLRSCREVRRAGRSIRVTLVGGGPLRAELEEEATRLGIRDAVEFAGQRSHEEIDQHLSRADLFVLACVVDDQGYHDGLPVALMEAMAAGLPVVSTRVSGIPELLEDGLSGLVVEPGDPAALAAAIVRVLDSPDLGASLSRGGRARIEELFNLDRNAREMAALFAGSVAPAV